MVRDDDSTFEDPKVLHDINGAQAQIANETPTTGGGTVPAAVGGTGTDTGTAGIGPSGGEPTERQPSADMRTGNFDLNAGTDHEMGADTGSQ